MKQICMMLVTLMLVTTTLNAGRFDPLDSLESKNVKARAKEHNDRHRRQPSSPGSPDIPRPNQNSDYEPLLVERHRVAKNASNRNQRLADVYWYDYGRDMLILNLVNVTTQEVLSVEESQGTQLPLTDVEIQRALGILVSDQVAKQRISDEYRSITGQPLNDYSSQVEMKAFVFHAATAPAQLQSDSLRCGINRCAQIMLFTPNEIAFEMMPIVNLSKNKVTDILAGF